ncbi:MAG: hypothetical protein AB1796_11685 [Bacillota bacterium]
MRWALAAFLQLVFLGAWRRFAWVWSLKRMGPLRLVVGSASRARERAHRLLNEGAGMYQVAGLVIERPELRFNEEPGLPVLGHFGSPLKDAQILLHTLKVMLMRGKAL